MWSVFGSFLASLFYCLKSDRIQLFAAASLKSASILLPIACEMANRERNYVHFAFMGRDDISMDILKSVNLGDAKECSIIIHGRNRAFVLMSNSDPLQMHGQTFLYQAPSSECRSAVQLRSTTLTRSSIRKLFLLTDLVRKKCSF